MIRDQNVRLNIRSALIAIAAICLVIACSQSGKIDIVSGKGDMLTYTQGWPLTHVEQTEFVATGEGRDVVASGWPVRPFASVNLVTFGFNLAIWAAIIIGLPVILEYAIRLWKRQLGLHYDSDATPASAG